MFPLWVGFLRPKLTVTSVLNTGKNCWHKCANFSKIKLSFKQFYKLHNYFIESYPVDLILTANLHVFNETNSKCSPDYILCQIISVLHKGTGLQKGVTKVLSLVSAWAWSLDGDLNQVNICLSIETGGSQIGGVESRSSGLTTFQVWYEVVLAFIDGGSYVTVGWFGWMGPLACLSPFSEFIQIS